MLKMIVCANNILVWKKKNYKSYRTTDVHAEVGTSMYVVASMYGVDMGRAAGVVKLHTSRSTGHNRSANCLCIPDVK